MGFVRRAEAEAAFVKCWRRLVVIALPPRLPPAQPAVETRLVCGVDKGEGLRHALVAQAPPALQPKPAWSNPARRCAALNVRLRSEGEAEGEAEAARDTE